MKVNTESWDYVGARNQPPFLPCLAVCRSPPNVPATPTNSASLSSPSALGRPRKCLLRKEKTLRLSLLVVRAAKREPIANRVQITTDGHKAYLEAVEGAFGKDVDYAMLVKLYGEVVEGQKRYSPAECVGIKKTKIVGNPDLCCTSTSFVERQNLTMRMSIRRFTRLTNAFSKKIENHAHSVALHYMHYNFCRIHKTLRTSPAMAAGVTAKLWSIADIVDMVEKAEAEEYKAKWGR
jgi:hypothetical protein